MDNSEVMFKPVTQRHDRVLIVGGGESLTDFDMDLLKDFKGAIICVNNIVYHLPRADYWITVDPMHNGEPQVALTDKVKGVYYFCAYPNLKKKPFDSPYYKAVDDVHYLERIVPINEEDGEQGDYSLQEDKDKITTGDSCYGALGLAYHFEAKEIILLGIDVYGFGHWYNKSDAYNRGWGKKFREYKSKVPLIYKQSVPQLEKRGVKVVNGSLNSKITCFERTTPEKAFTYFDK